MLPERMCNFICSLRPDEEKLCYSVIFLLDDEANVKSFHIAHTVIKSNRRYAYEEVQSILERRKGKEKDDDPYTEELCTLDQLAKCLRERRFKGGAVKFDREELHFDIDEKGKPTRAYFKKSNDATQLIEEFMLLANRTVAESIGKKKAANGKTSGSKAKTFAYPATAAGGNAPLKVAEGSAASIPTDGTTGVQGVKIQTKPAVKGRYTLQGVPLPDNVEPKGIYIEDGKKVVRN